MRNGEDKQNFRVNSSPSSTHLSFPHPHLQCLMSRVAFGPFSDGAGGPRDCSAAALSFCCSFFLTPFTCSAINCHMTCRPLGPIACPSVVSCMGYNSTYRCIFILLWSQFLEEHNKICGKNVIRNVIFGFFLTRLTFKT